MYPVIFKVGPVVLHSYGLMLALAVFATAWLTAIEAGKRLGISRECVFDLGFWVVLGGLLGARIFYIVLNLDYFFSYPVEVLMVWQGGLAWQGSFIGGLIAFFFYSRQHKIPRLKFLDIVMPYVALGHAIGRIGCLFNGCCYGKPVAWGIYFSFSKLPLHPTQIYMSIEQIMIFLVLRRVQGFVKKDGQVLVLYLLLSSIGRFVIEFFRGDHGMYAGLSIFQYVSLVIFSAALFLSFRLSKSGMS